MSSPVFSVREIPSDDLDLLERTAQHVATQIGPHEGLALRRFALRVPLGGQVVHTGDCAGARTYLEHGCLHGEGGLVGAAPDAVVHLLLVAGTPTYDKARVDLESWWDQVPEGGLIAFLDAQEHGIRALLEERVFLSKRIANIGYIGRMVYARKIKNATREDQRRNRRLMRLWRAHIQLQRVPMPRPVRVAGREVMKRMQGKRDRLNTDDAMDTVNVGTEPR